MRVIRSAVMSFLLVSGEASGQSVELLGSAGPTISDPGYSLAAGVGFYPASRVAVLFDVERTHLSERFRSDGRGGGAAFRGGTLTFVAAEVRVVPLGRDRVSPYVLGGFGAGWSRPNVSETFPGVVTNNARALFAGAGIHVPLRERISVFCDARIMLGEEAGELLAIVPIRGGLAWRF